MRLPQIKNPKTIERLLWRLLDVSSELADLMYEKPKAIVDVRAKVNVLGHAIEDRFRMSVTDQVAPRDRLLVSFRSGTCAFRLCCKN